MLSIDGKLVSYAQNREDVILNGYFANLERPGFYIDIGANHPIEDSVTKFFYLRDWRGINIEPQPELHDLLLSDRPEDINLRVGIADKAGKAKMRQYEQHGLSTFSSDQQIGYANAASGDYVDFLEYEVPMRTLRSVLGEHAAGQAIHFMKVDVEGFESVALASNNWKRFRPWVICVESTGTDKRWQKILDEAGYQNHIRDGLNDFYVAKEQAELINGYLVHVASGVIRYDIAKELARLRQRSLCRRLGNRMRRVTKK